MSCRRTDFRAGVDLLVDGVSLSLEDANIAAPSLIAPLEEARGAPASRERARLVSLRHAKVAQLTVSRLDLRACRFAYAHGLDSMRLERVYFNQPPPRAGLGWRWSRRQTIAEEHQWRNKEHPDTGWYGKAVCAPGWLENPGENPGAVLSEEEIEAIYRSLRKSREDSKNEPGAGDFYYGEMEMRRHRPPAHLPEHGPTSSGNASGAVRSQANDNLGKLERPVSDAERGLLWLYWLVAGYGLRASRSLAALALAIAVASVPLALGVPPQPALPRIRSSHPVRGGEQHEPSTRPNRQAQRLRPGDRHLHPASGTAAVRTCAPVASRARQAVNLESPASRSPQFHQQKVQTPGALLLSRLVESSPRVGRLTLFVVECGPRKRHPAQRYVNLLDRTTIRTADPSKPSTGQTCSCDVADIRPVRTRALLSARKRCLTAPGPHGDAVDGPRA